MTPLHHIGDFFRDALLQIPLPAVRLLFVALQVALLIWVLTLPREATRPPDGSGGWAANLKIWAALAISVQVLVYSVL